MPLSSRASEILRESQIGRESALVFPSARGKALSDATISKLVRENGLTACHMPLPGRVSGRGVRT